METLDRINSTLESHSTYITEAEQINFSVLEERLDVEKRITVLTDNLDNIENLGQRDNIREPKGGCLRDKPNMLL